MKKVIFIYVVSIFMVGCKGNSIYYDSTNQSILTCEGNNITSLDIVCQKEHEYFSFRIKDYSKSKPHFNLTTIDTIFTLTSIGKSIPISDFVIKPNRMYEVQNSSVGDAAYIKIEITTDSVGNIISASKTSCKN